MFGDSGKNGKTFREHGVLSRSLELLSNAYGVSASFLVQQLMSPMKRYYLRVNLMKATVDEAIKILNEEGVKTYKSGMIDEALFVEVDKGEKIQARDKIVIAEREAAERVMLGSDLYMPGIKKILKARKGDEVTVISENGVPVAEGILEIEPRELNRNLKGLAVKVLKSLYKLPKIRELEAYKRGIITDQSYPSMLIGRELYTPLSGQVYIDMTASPGGKIGHIYEITKGRGKYFAFDHTNKKIERLKSELFRIGANEVFVDKQDSRFLSLHYPDLKSNFTILDPPCSGFGNRPRLSLSDIDDDVMKNLVSLQKQLLKEAVKITKPGGYISYSTCSITYEENEGQVRWAIDNLPVELVYPQFPFPQSKLTDFPVARFVPGLHDTIGFFFALFRRA
ncbi:MAG: PUA domain-containing protein [Fervidicoccaceae archaeon]